MVRENLHRVFCPLAVSSPVFEEVHNSEEFFVVDFVGDFSGLELLQLKGNRV